MRQVARTENIDEFIESADSLKFYSLLSLNKNFQNCDSFPTIKYHKLSDDGMNEINDIRSTFKPIGGNGWMYSKNSWIVLLHALHDFFTYLKGIRNDDHGSKRYLIFPKYWDFISGMNRFKTIKTWRKVILNEEIYEVMNHF